MRTKLLLFGARLAGTAALLLGGGYWLGWPVPLHAHMAVGGVLVLCLWGLALGARSVAGGTALAAALLGGALPVLGLIQVQVDWGAALDLVRLVHVAAGLGAISLAEMLGRRLAVARG